MSRNLDSPTHLTEFAPLNPEARPSGVTSLFSKFFKISRNDSPGPATPPREQFTANSVDESERSSPPSDVLPSPASGNQSGDISLAFDASEGRSLPNVLKRISSILALKTEGLQAYKDTDLKQYWMPDSKSRECYDCGERFTPFRRRHHCRICGQIFCSRCCSQEVSGKIVACTGDLRVCTYCCKVVLSYLQSVDISADLSADLRALQEHLQTKFGRVDAPLSSNSSQATHGVIAGATSVAERQDTDLDPAGCMAAHRKTSIGYIEEQRFVLARDNIVNKSVVEEGNRWNTQESAALSALAEELARPNRGIATQTVWYRLRNQHSVFYGNQLVTWLMSNGKAATREQGVAIGGALVEAGFIECVGEQGFTDGLSPYRLTEKEAVSGAAPQSTDGDAEFHRQHKSADDSTDSHNSSREGQEPTWVKDLPHRTLDSTTTTDSESECLVSGSEHDSVQSMRSSRSLYRLDLNIQQNVVHLSRPPTEDAASFPNVASAPHQSAGSWSPQSSATEVTASCEFLGDSLLDTAQAAGSDEPVTWHETAHLTSDNGDLQAYTTLNSVYRQHEEGLLRQLLNGQGLAQSWGDVILPLISYVAGSINVSSSESGNMDIRQYVQVKKVPGGDRSDCVIVNGIVCTKNIAHRAMASRLQNPQILLLDCAVVYQRDEGRLLSLESIMMQEQECLRNAVARIAALQPDIVMVSRTVGRLAQESLLALGVTLVLNVKLSVLERIARCTYANILKAVDVQISPPRLGTCKDFYLRTFITDTGVEKTLMFFEGCRRPDLGRSIILRGGSHSELTRLKNVMRFMVYVRYSWRLELSYLMDEFASPPSPPPDAFFDDTSFARSNSISNCKSPPRGRQSTSSNKSAFDADSASTKRTNSDLDEQPVCSSTPIVSTPEDDIFTFDSPDHLHSNPKARVEKTLSQSSATQGTSSDEQEAKFVAEGERDAGKRRPTTESISDFSDPLHQYLTQGDDGTQSSQSATQQELAVARLPFLNKFRKALDDTILSASPYLKFNVPYLETEQAVNSNLRKFFPVQIYWSAQFESDGVSARSRGSTTGGCSDLIAAQASRPQIKMAPRHPFVEAKLTNSVTSNEVQTLLALYRANGGRLTPSSTMKYLPVNVPHTDRSNIHNYHDCQDALEPASHQHLTFLFYKISQNNQNQPSFCGDPRVITLDFYGHHISLGSFLENYCFDPKSDCGCKVKPLRHTRRYVHNGGCVQVKLNMLEQVLPGSKIWMWSCCIHCKVTTPAVPMSPDTCSLSFAKYLELRFYGDMYTCRKTKDKLTEAGGSPTHPRCNHSLHYDFIQYFAQRNIVASVRYSSITVCEVLLPPPMVNTVWGNDLAQFLSNDLKNIVSCGQEVFSNVRRHLSLVPTESPGGAALHQQLKKEQTAFKTKADEVKNQLDFLVNVKEKDKWAAMWHAEDGLVDVVRMLLEAIPTWNSKIQEVLGKPRSSAKTFNFLQDSTEKAALTESVTKPLILEGIVESQSCDDAPMASPCEDCVQAMASDNVTASAAPNDGSVDNNVPVLTEKVREEGKEDQPTEKRLSNTSSSIPVAAFQTQTSSETPNTGAPEKLWPAEQESEGTGGKEVRDGLPPDPVSTSIVESKQPSAVSHQHLSDKKTVKTILSQFLPSTPPLVYVPVPAGLQELHVMSRNNTVFPLVVCESQPSSIIAYALASADYRRTLDEMRTASQQNFNIKSKGEAGTIEGAVINGSASRDGSSGQGNTGSVGGSVPPPQPSGASKEEKPSTYIELQFSDATTKFYCRVYFADDFCKLRKLVWPSGEEGFMRSLSHCVPWDARGGKSGSTFCKTRDDRLVLKEMSRTELTMFLEHAPHYFKYVTDCHKHERPTLLGKILGVYKVAHNSEATGAGFFVLVMENLFYARSVTHKFDLKGSVRNRLANPHSESRSEIVLLDENLIKMTCNKPLYLQPHSEAVLKQAIQNDTQFLSSQSVMDYSLLVGLDEGGKVFVVGIIDYIRTFTLDKKLETVIKKAISSQGETPTIVSPKEYRIRFINAMGRYFLPVPDRWYGLGRGFN